MMRILTLWNQKGGIDADKYDFEFDDSAKCVVIRGESIDTEFLRRQLNRPAQLRYEELCSENALSIDASFSVVVETGGQRFQVDRDSLTLVPTDSAKGGEL